MRQRVGSFAEFVSVKRLGTLLPLASALAMNLMVPTVAGHPPYSICMLSSTLAYVEP